MSYSYSDPGEWVDIVRRIQSGDTSVGSRLAERERRQQNVMQFSTYRPVLSQEDTMTAQYPADTYADVQRIDNRVNIHFSCSIASTTGSADIQFMDVSLPPMLAQFGPGQGILVGTSWWYTNIGTFLLGGVTYDTVNNRLQTYPNVAWQFPPQITWADVDKFGFSASYRLPGHVW